MASTLAMVYYVYSTEGSEMTTYRKLDATSFEEAKSQLKPGEELVVSGPNTTDPQHSCVPVTSDKSFRVMTGNGSPRGVPYARKS